MRLAFLEQYPALYPCPARDNATEEFQQALRFYLGRLGTLPFTSVPSMLMYFEAHVTVFFTSANTFGYATGTKQFGLRRQVRVYI